LGKRDGFKFIKIGDAIILLSDESAYKEEEEEEKKASVDENGTCTCASPRHIAKS